MRDLPLKVEGLLWGLLSVVQVPCFLLLVPVRTWTSLNGKLKAVQSSRGSESKGWTYDLCLDSTPVHLLRYSVVRTLQNFLGILLPRHFDIS